MGRPHRPHRRRDAAARSLHGRVYGADGDHAPGDRVFDPVERVMYRLTGVDEKREQRWQTYAFSLLAFSFVSVIVLYRAATGPELAAAEPDRCRRTCPSALVQHRGQLRHQHELAELRAREHGQPPHADGRARDAELRVRGRRHCGRDRARTRAHPPARGAPSGTSGSTSRARSPASCIPLSIVFALDLRQPGHDPEPPRLHRGHHARRARRR